MIGFDSNRLVYEGESFYGRGLWPTPVITLATHIANTDSFHMIPVSDDLMCAKLAFREDSFDPVTRIRRGRFYFNPGGNPILWHVHPHSFLPSQALTDMRLTTYQRWQAAKELRSEGCEALVALGIADAYTMWRVVDIERISTGDDLVTLRARSSLGLLPELLQAEIPLRSLEHVVCVVDKAIQAAFRAGPESVIDRCRDAAQACVGVWFADKTKNELDRTADLSPLLDKVEKHFANEPPMVLLNAARIIARLHARKPNEQLKRSLRGNLEGDAEVALSNLGLVLREIGWARE
jgi:hypothetical protein